MLFKVYIAQGESGLEKGSDFLKVTQKLMAKLWLEISLCLNLPLTAPTPHYLFYTFLFSLKLTWMNFWKNLWYLTAFYTNPLSETTNHRPIWQLEKMYKAGVGTYTLETSCYLGKNSINWLIWKKHHHDYDWLESKGLFGPKSQLWLPWGSGPLNLFWKTDLLWIQRQLRTLLPEQGIKMYETGCI